MDLEIKTFRTCLTALVLGACVAGVAPAAGLADEPAAADAKHADQNAEKNGKNSPKKLETKSAHTPEEQETAALALVTEHHPELIDLLEQLKADNSKQYQQAIAELYRASQKLSQRKAKDPPRYELELKAWKLDSQARLLAAKLTMDANPQLEERLMAVLLEREDVAIALLGLERNRISDRLKQADRQLDKHREQRESRAKLAFEQLTRRSGKVRSMGLAPKDSQAAAKKPKPSKARRIEADAQPPKAGQIQVPQESANKSPGVVKPSGRKK